MLWEFYTMKSDKIFRILGALLSLDRKGYDNLYIKDIAKILHKVSAADFHQAISLTDTPAKYRNFVNWKEINKIFRGNQQ